MPKRTRKQQVDGFIHQVKSGKSTLEVAMQSACFVGACEERDWCLQNIDAIEHLLNWQGRRLLKDAITSRSVLEVLGYERKPKKKA